MIRYRQTMLHARINTFYPMAFIDRVNTLSALAVCLLLPKKLNPIRIHKYYKKGGKVI